MDLRNTRRRPSDRTEPFRRATAGAAAGLSLLLLQASSFDPTIIIDALMVRKIQILLGIVLAFLLAMGVFSRRFPRFFEKAALVFGTAILVLLALELVSLGILSYAPGVAGDDAGGNVQDPSQSGYDEGYIAGGGGISISPFTGWTARPVNTAQLGTDEEGNRLTPGGDPRASYTVFTFGGSAMWGEGVPDGSTIAAFIQAGLDSLPGRSVEVDNYGQIGWTSTQSLVRLVLELQKGNVPDLVVFYDGIADADAAYSTGRAGSHLCIEAIGDRIEGARSSRPSPTPGEILESTAIFAIAGSLADSPGAVPGLSSRTLPELLGPLPEGMSGESLAADVADCYFRNMDAVDVLSRSYGFRYLFVWQPIACFGNKVLTPDEVEIVDMTNQPLLDYYRLLWQRMSTQAGARTGYAYLGKVFELASEPLYLDEGCLNPMGNRRVAQAVIATLLESSALAGR